MAASDKIDKMKELNAILKEAADAYYNRDSEIMSNYEYDKLYDELLELESETGVVLSGSITQRVGYEVTSALPKERHSEKMLSLDKTKSREELKDWLGDKDGCMSWKLDGSTCVLYYAKGKLVKAVTRGNGEVGEVITEQAKCFANVPISIPFKGELVVRGEALMRYSEFERINALIDDVESKYKNPRNLASGTMRALDTSVLSERSVEFHAFTLVSSSQKMSNSYCERLSWLEDNGFTSVFHKKVSKDDVLDAVCEFEKEVEHNDLPSDGLVVFYDDVAYGESLGETSKFPRNGLAFKWSDETADTTLVRIEWQPSRTGRVNPVAIFEPVELEGTTVSKATLNNLSFISDLLGTPFEGQQLTVYKANKIIPCIIDAETSGRTEENEIEIPSRCPSCDGLLVRQMDNDSEFLICENDTCPAKIDGSMEHFVSRDGLNVMGLSSEKIKMLKAGGVLDSFSDLLHIKDREDEIVGKIGNFQKKSFDNLVAAIEDAKNELTAQRLLYALGIREIGRSASRDISAFFGGDFQKMMGATKEELMQIDGIGEKMAENYMEFFSKNSAMASGLLEELDLAGQENTMVKANESSAASGKTFVITGALNTYSNRKAAQDDIEAHGGKLAGSVSSKTDFLVTNDTTSNSSKNRKAAELGIPVITEQQLIDMLSK